MSLPYNPSRSSFTKDDRPELLLSTTSRPSTQQPIAHCQEEENKTSPNINENVSSQTGISLNKSNL